MKERMNREKRELKLNLNSNHETIFGIERHTDTWQSLVDRDDDDDYYARIFVLFMYLKDFSTRKRHELSRASV